MQITSYPFNHQVFYLEFLPTSGFPPGMLERERSKKRWAVWRNNQHSSFKFVCLKWPISPEMTTKSGIYCHFLCQRGGGEISPPVVLRGWVRTPPAGNPAPEAGTSHWCDSQLQVGENDSDLSSFLCLYIVYRVPGSRILFSKMCYCNRGVY